jgi:hypothetical protein
MTPIVGSRVRVEVPRGASSITGRHGVVTELGPHVLGCPSAWAMVLLDGDDEPYSVHVWELVNDSETPKGSASPSSGADSGSK